MQSLGLQDLLTLAEEKANEEKKLVSKHLGKSNATISSIRNVLNKLPDKDFYFDSSAEASFKAKIQGLLDDLPPLAKLDTALVERYAIQLNNFQIEVARSAARLIPKFSRGRKVEVAELELHLRELAKITALLLNIRLDAMREAEGAEQLIRRIRAQTAELQQLQTARVSVAAQMEKLREEEVELDKGADALNKSEVARRMEELDAGTRDAIQSVSAMFSPTGKPIEKLRKLLEDRRAPTSEISPLIKCNEHPLNLLNFDQVELDRAGRILRGYIERDELAIKQSRAKRALDALSEMHSLAPDLKERLSSLRIMQREVVASSEAAELSTKRGEIEERAKQMERQLSGLAADQSNLEAQLERCALKLQNLKREGEAIAGKIASEPVTLII
jgi:hypothetical protein